MPLPAFWAAILPLECSIVQANNMRKVTPPICLSSMLSKNFLRISLLASGGAKPNVRGTSAARDNRTSNSANVRVHTPESQTICTIVEVNSTLLACLNHILVNLFGGFLGIEINANVSHMRNAKHCFVHALEFQRPSISPSLCSTTVFR